jgi:hypothetical protein
MRSEYYPFDNQSGVLDQHLLKGPYNDYLLGLPNSRLPTSARGGQMLRPGKGYCRSFLGEADSRQTPRAGGPSPSKCHLGPLRRSSP